MPPSQIYKVPTGSEVQIIPENSNDTLQLTQKTSRSIGVQAVRGPRPDPDPEPTPEPEPEPTPEPPPGPPEIGKNLFPYDGTFLNPPHDVSGTREEIASRIVFAPPWQQSTPQYIWNGKRGLHRPLPGSTTAFVEWDRDYIGGNVSTPSKINLYPPPPAQPEATAHIIFVDRIPPQATHLSFSLEEAQHMIPGHPDFDGLCWMEITCWDEPGETPKRLWYLEGTTTPAVTPTSRVASPAGPFIIPLIYGVPKYVQFKMYGKLLAWNAAVLRGGLSLIPLALTETGEELLDESASPAPVSTVPAPAPARAREVEATDGAKELARKSKIDLATVKGSGEDGRILVDDVRKAIAASKK